VMDGGLDDESGSEGDEPSKDTADVGGWFRGSHESEYSSDDVFDDVKEPSVVVVVEDEAAGDDSGSDESDGELDGGMVVVVTERGLGNEAGDDTDVVTVEGTESGEESGSGDEADEVDESLLLVVVMDGGLDDESGSEGDEPSKGRPDAVVSEEWLQPGSSVTVVTDDGSEVNKDIFDAVPEHVVWVTRSDSVSLLAMTVDEQSRITGCNLRGYELVGYESEAELVGHELVSEFVSVKGRVAVDMLIEKAMDGEATHHVGIQLLSKDEVLESVVVDFLPKLTEHGEALVEVIESRSFSNVNILTHGLGDDDLMAWVSDASGEVVACNSTVARELGYHRREVVNKSVVDDLVGAGSRKHTEEVLEQVMSQQESFGNVDVEMQCKDGSELSVVVDVGPVREWGGSVDLGVMLDVNPLERWGGEGAFWVGKVEEPSKETPDGDWFRGKPPGEHVGNTPDDGDWFRGHDEGESSSDDVFDDVKEPSVG
jgi:PAS domain S-box-containing protein